MAGLNGQKSGDQTGTGRYLTSALQAPYHKKGRTKLVLPLHVKRSTGLFE